MTKADDTDSTAPTEPNIRERADELAAQLGPPFSDVGAGKRALAYLLAARTETEHRHAAAAVAVFLFDEFRGWRYGDGPDTSPIGARITFGSALRRAPRRGPGKKQPRDQRALDDMATVWPMADMAASVKRLARGTGITEQAARERLQRAEEITGTKIPPSRPPKRS